MRWVTRAACHVDRTACAWLIRRHIDPGAEFVFVSDPEQLPDDAVAFDIAGHPFSHHGGDTTFEVLVRHYELTDSALAGLGHIVHEADLEDERYDAPEASGVDAIVRGLGELMTDPELIEVTSRLYDGLVTHIRQRK